MTLEDSIHAFRLLVMARAHELSNVTRACREFGISRTLYYRWRKRYLASTAGMGCIPVGKVRDGDGRR